MTAWLNALNTAWNELARTAPVARQYRSKIISAQDVLEVRAGMRAVDDAPCLILQTLIGAEALFELGGMRLSNVPDPDGPLLILSLEDGSRRDLFATICADVVATAAGAGQHDAQHRFVARLDAWRQFLRDRQAGMTRQETVGLIGELLILERLLAVDPHSLDTWKSPRDGLHDFDRSGHALEAKASLGPSPTITISALDQLDTAGVRALDLLHVRLVVEPRGRGLKEIINAVTEVLPDETARRSFENALLRRGLMPDDERARLSPRIQLRSIDAYSVAEGFPRLIRSTLPAAITDAAYKLEVRALAPFSADLAVALGAFIQGHHS